MADALGLMQFLAAVSELARGATAPTVPPVWERHLLEARDVPRPCFAHREYDEVPGAMSLGLAMPLDDMATRSFFLGRQELVAIRSRLTPDLQKRASKFDIVAGWLWRCRTVALAPDSDDEMRLIFIVNARGRNKKPTTNTNSKGIPDGYYGNAFALPVAVSKAGELCEKPLSYAVELVKKAKDEVSMEYMQSTADLMVLRGRPLPCTTAGTYSLSDVTKARFDSHDFGWGKPVYGGPADAVGSPSMPWLASFLLPFKNADGEDGILVPTSLPRPAMDRFVEQMGQLLVGLSTDDVATL
ncbi:hypothetical protein PR202_ga15288 [Eleusine coracana subsp. coracana]|uniref:Benzyl alcohol O-benzoyltransferase n=1 Tax=Eleusine coracana subsp. coracana TaxID=191504 RepID=A0AAV5CJS5_ELECO|nr:hypothetical protein QOZ80_6BG0494790 [Eleusine coracana subsp. coracana]GJM98293.1 hypothetical protein PR202_ga15288 [Eleusine coracana subsp. coracana]